MLPRFLHCYLSTCTPACTRRVTLMEWFLQGAAPLGSTIVHVLNTCMDSSMMAILVHSIQYMQVLAPVESVNVWPIWSSHRSPTRCTHRQLSGPMDKAGSCFKSPNLSKPGRHPARPVQPLASIKHLDEPPVQFELDTASPSLNVPLAGDSPTPLNGATREAPEEECCRLLG